MDFTEYTEKTSRTMNELGNKTADEIHMILGIATESAELLDAYKKKLAYGKDLDVTNIKEELGDILWYMSNYMRIMDIDFYDVLDINIGKLKSRYKDNFTKEEALYRDLEEERIVMEKLREELSQEIDPE